VASTVKAGNYNNKISLGEDAYCDFVLTVISSKSGFVSIKITSSFLLFMAVLLGFGMGMLFNAAYQYVMDARKKQLSRK
jgi:hypothetical protein